MTIIPRRGKKESDLGRIVCAGCGVEESHPTRESDGWHACWCADPDTCPTCGPCEKCFKETDYGCYFPVGDVPAAG
jgi:hypothetical protein